MRTTIGGCLCAILLGLTACSGGGGGGGGAITPSSSGPVVLGSRAVPGHVITATKLSSTADAMTLRIALASDPGLSVAGVGVRVGTTYVEDGGFTAAVATTDGWTVMLPKPSSLAGLRAWVRVTESDGTLTETGIEDFALR